MLLAILAILSLLPSPSLTMPPLRFPSSTAEAKRTFRCLTPDDGGQSKVDTVHRSNCAAALDLILKSDKSEAPMIFSRSPGAGYKVPATIEAGDCVVHIDVSSMTPGREVTLPLTDVVHAAFHIIDMCIKNPPAGTGLGGHAILDTLSDSRGVLDVLLYGQAFDPGRPPPMDLVPDRIIIAGHL